MEEGPSRALELACGRNAACHDLLREAMGALGCLGAEVADVDTRLEVEGLRLVHEWRELKVAINLGHLQHERSRA